MINVFNIFFLITCGLVNKIDKECLLIFNENNKAKTLFKKYAKIVLNNLNENIKCIENKIMIFQIKMKDSVSEKFAILIMFYIQI